MNELDKRLYRLFAFWDFIALWYWENNELPKYLKLPEPHLHDVFRAWVNNWYCPAQYYDEEYSKFIISFERKIKERQFTQDDISYDPTLSLLNQSDETKQQIINLFN